MLKRLISLFMVLFILAGSTVGSNALNVGGVSAEPRWNNVYDIAITLEEYSGKLNLTVYIDGLDNTFMNDISIGLFKMTRPNQGTVAQWSGMSTTSNYYFFNQLVEAEPSGSYRVIVRFNAVRNGVSEAVNAHLDKVF